MHTESDGSTTTPAPAPGNIFTSEYLALLSPCDEDEPVPTAEAATSEPVPDPWHLEPHPMEPGWAVLPQGKSMFTTQPHVSSQNIDFARLAAAVLPSTEQPPRYRLGQEQDALGYPVFAGEQVVGHFQFFDETLLAAINVVAAVVSVPGDLAWLLHAAGGPALDHAGKIALERSLPRSKPLPLGRQPPSAAPVRSSGLPFHCKISISSFSRASVSAVGSLRPCLLPLPSHL